MKLTKMMKPATQEQLDAVTASLAKGKKKFPNVTNEKILIRMCALSLAAVEKMQKQVKAYQAGIIDSIPF